MQNFSNNERALLLTRIENWQLNVIELVRGLKTPEDYEAHAEIYDEVLAHLAKGEGYQTCTKEDLWFEDPHGLSLSWSQVIHPLLKLKIL